jgi:Tol biopolymer transport system component
MREGVATLGIVFVALSLAASPSFGVTPVSLVSLGPSGPAGGSLEPRQAISADGKRVVFVSPASNLVTGQVDSNGQDDVFLFDRSAGTVRLVSHQASLPTTAGTGSSRQPVISKDGRYVAYTSDSTDLVAGQTDTNGATDLFVYDVLNGTTALVSHQAASPLQAGDNASDRPVISGDGSFIAYMSASTDLIAGFTSGGPGMNLYLFDRLAGTSRLVSHQSGSLTTTGNDETEWNGAISRSIRPMAPRSA